MAAIASSPYNDADEDILLIDILEKICNRNIEIPTFRISL